jgi:hypothetical protein
VLDPKNLRSRLFRSVMPRWSSSVRRLSPDAFAQRRHVAARQFEFSTEVRGAPTRDRTEIADMNGAM